MRERHDFFFIAGKRPVPGVSGRLLISACRSSAARSGCGGAVCGSAGCCAAASVLMKAAATMSAIGTEKMCGDGRLLVTIDSSTCAQVL
jgi:hypothetical protein